MRTLLIALLALATAGAALAQEPAAPQGRFYGPLIPKTGTLQPLPGNAGALPLKLVLPQPAKLATQATPPANATRCAVPLIQMQAPTAGYPGIQLVPRTGNVEPMPQANLPPA